MHNLVDPTKNVAHVCSLPSIDPTTLHSVTDLLLPDINNNDNNNTQQNKSDNNSVGSSTDNNLTHDPFLIQSCTTPSHSHITRSNHTTPSIKRRRTSQHTNDSNSSTGSSSGSNSNNSMSPDHKIYLQKQKHLQSDRTRRHKIRAGVEQLKQLVISDHMNNNHQRIDQAQIVSASVHTILSLHDTVDKLQTELSISQQSYKLLQQEYIQLQQQYNNIIQ